VKHHDWLLRIGKNASWELIKVSDLEPAAPDATKR
jgi:hypothetical protein